MKKQKIPKIIHYCWFGAQEKPPIVKKCIESWKKHLTGYELKEWNESNVDIQENRYVHEAYKAGKYAFVSDYIRIKSLYNFGGIYLDTDVEVFKSFDELLGYESFWGFEQENYIATSTIGAAPKNVLIKKILTIYKDIKFINKDGSLNELTNVVMVTKTLENFGVIRNGKFQIIREAGVVLPQTFLSPFDYINCRNFITNETYAIHHFYKSWLPKKTRLTSITKTIVSKVIGGNNIYKLRKMLSR